ncbi:MAG: glycogen/starch/alpha-glucan phosphorylase [bacterium]
MSAVKDEVVEDVIVLSGSKFRSKQKTTVRDGRERSLQSPDLQQSIKNHVKYSLGKNWPEATEKDIFRALSLTVREKLIDGMLATEARYQKKDAKRIYYLSMEFLMGRALGNNLFNLGLFDLCQDALAKLGFDIDEIRDCEQDAALGNGGLGRLAACFIDSMAALGIPGYGYGINYEYGLFKQKIDNGYQKELPDHWQRDTTPWLIERPQEACLVPLYGCIVEDVDINGQYNPMWMDWKVLYGVPYDMPIVGYNGKTVNFLRLYSAKASDEFDMQIFNTGDYLKAVKQKMATETVAKVLYPADDVEAGRELRLVQEYFLVACSVRDIVNRHLKTHKSINGFSSKVAIQLNDTHPALTVAELMRLLIDEHDLSWKKAWETTVATLGYTNHTLLPEALEKWSVSLLEKVLPRHLQIIYEINHRFMTHVASVWPGDLDRLKRMSIIEEDGERKVRMAYLSIIGSHSVNGVAELHSELVKSQLVPDFYELWPEKFNNKTNGVTQRRWLLKANPPLSRLITDTIGDGWITDLYELKKLEPFAGKRDFQRKFIDIRQQNKKRLADIIKKTARVEVDPSTLFDVQIKRIHEYKRQLLSVMQIIHQYYRIVEDSEKPAVARTYIFAGKAAPGYDMAKLIIKLINSVAEIINNDPRVDSRIKVVFIPDYRVSLAEKIFPAADLSEQISTAGKEASGTGNMKFALNGALTIGTWDGANIEIGQEVGADNIYIFGLKANEVADLQQNGGYNPWDDYHSNPHVARVMASLASDQFCPEEPGLFKPIYDNIMHAGDEYFHLADLASYIEAQALVTRDYLKPSLWAKKAILNVARSGKFSSDRTIAEYANEIWKIKPVL